MHWDNKGKNRKKGFQVREPHGKRPYSWKILDPAKLLRRIQYQLSPMTEEGRGMK